MADVAARAPRLGLIDTLRGFCVLGMVVYHTLFDVSLFFGGANAAAAAVFHAVGAVGAAAFIFLSGVCLHFTRRPGRRFLLLFFGGAAVSAATFLAEPESGVIFGILTFMAVSGGLGCLLRPALRRAPAAPLFALCLGLFLLCFNMNYGYLGPASHPLPLPAALYRDLLTAFLGFPYSGFSSGDYFPLFPWLFVYFAGYFFYAAFGGRAGVKRLLARRLRFPALCGRYSLYVYLAHQPLLYGAVWLISRLFP